MKTLTLRLPLLIALIFSLLSPSTIAHATGFVVTKTADTADGACDTDCSLREAIIAANAAPGDDTITVPPGTYTLTLAGTGEDATATGDLDITSNITINGAGAGSTFIQAGLTAGSAIDRVFHVTGAFMVNISGVTVRNGSGVNIGGGIDNEGGTLVITNSTFSGNSTSYDGSGIYSTGTLNITNSTFSGNSTSGGSGGGVYTGGTATITNSIFSGNNVAGGHGGGVYNIGTLIITKSTFTGNSAPDNGGGGIFNNNLGLTLNIANSTFSGNSAFGGGGIYTNDGTVTITNSTFSGNSATNRGGGIYRSTGTVTLRNTIVANSTSGGNCGGSTITDGGNNIDDGITCGWGSTSGSMSSTSPLLGALTGSPAYFPLLPGSPAIDAGDDAICAATPVGNTSQNGLTRPQGPHCDIGSVEAKIYRIYLPLTLKSY